MVGSTARDSQRLRLGISMGGAGSFPTRRVVVRAHPWDAMQQVAGAFVTLSFAPSGFDLNATLQSARSPWCASSVEIGSALHSGFKDALTEMVPFLLFSKRSGKSLPLTRVAIAAREIEPLVSELFIAQQTSSAGSFAGAEALVQQAIAEAIAGFAATGALLDSGTALRPNQVPQDCPAHIWEFKRLMKSSKH